MSPLDDELRSALHSRAAGVAASPDPLAGVERRARTMRRNRVAASVAGSALAVAAIAAVVPALQSGRATGPQPPSVASAAPTEAVTASSYALDPENPWDYRGTPLGKDFVDALATEVAARHGQQADAGRVIALFGQRYEPSGQLEAVFVSRRSGDGATWGVARSSESGLEVVSEQALAPGTNALVAALPGDEVGRLLVVSAPDASRAEYAPDATSGYTPMTALAPGVWTGPREGDAATDSVRVVAFDGTEVFRGPRARRPGARGARRGHPAGQRPGLAAARSHRRRPRGAGGRGVRPGRRRHPRDGRARACCSWAATTRGSATS